LTNAQCGLLKISKIVPIVLALCLMLLAAYYANYYAGIINWSLPEKPTSVLFGCRALYEKIKES